MGTILGKCGTNCQEDQKVCKVFRMTWLRFEEIPLHCIAILIFFINFVELWVAFCQLWAELWVANLNQMAHPRLKIGLVNPPSLNLTCF